MQLTDAALDFLADAGYDPEFGARPVKRAIQRYLLNDLSKTMLAQHIDRTKPIIVDADGNGLVFRNLSINKERECETTHSRSFVRIS